MTRLLIFVALLLVGCDGSKPVAPVGGVAVEEDTVSLWNTTWTTLDYKDFGFIIPSDAPIMELKGITGGSTEGFVLWFGYTGPRIERDTITVITDTIHAPDKRCHECWDSVATLNQRIEVLEQLLYHGGE